MARLINKNAETYLSLLDYDCCFSGKSHTLAGKLDCLMDTSVINSLCFNSQNNRGFLDPSWRLITRKFQKGEFMLLLI